MQFYTQAIGYLKQIWCVRLIRNTSQRTKESDNVSTMNAYNRPILPGSNYRSDRRVAESKAIPMRPSSGDLMLGYLLALVSAALLLLTGQPPWFLLTVAVALAVAFFLPRGLHITRSK